MDYARKLEILANADFSEWRMNWERPSMGMLFCGLRGAMSNLADQYEEQPKEMLQMIICAYNNMLIYYSEIPFDELDNNDEDFKFLFNFRDRLDDLGEKLEQFIDKSLEKNLMSREWKEFQDAIHLVDKLYHASGDYREVILARNGIKRSQPTIINSCEYYI
ncbi:MAG: hypothetical protein NT001_01365 [Candidatus Woesearchaeota archaeon]|nr:hypothetical protein [Candidatus Woesearchaeota archaeon]